jgi:hypothetical protein
MLLLFKETLFSKTVEFFKKPDFDSDSDSALRLQHTGCLIKNALTHNFFIYYPISMNKKTEDMVFHALRSR